MTALQVIIKEAKAIRNKNPKMEWKKAVAQASAIYASKHKGKSPVGKKKAAKKVVRKKAAKKKISGSSDYYTRKKEGRVIARKTKHKKAAKKKPSEQSILNKIHKVKHDVEILDEAQHKHMSGISNYALDSIKKAMQTQGYYEILHKKYMSLPLNSRKKFASSIKKLKHLIKENKIHITQLKKGI